jgi:release factor glutamine methyltransferase
VTLQQALTLARERLAALKDVENPSLESEVLLRYALHVTRAKLHLDLDKDLDPEKEKLFRGWMERRLQGEPAAYIIQCREFFGLDFYVDTRVLIPRPETELLVEEAIKFAHDQRVVTMADIGTGSGAIAISLAVNLPRVEIYATDISAPALEVAAINSRKHQVTDRITLIQGDLLEPLPAPVDILIANLPYVTKDDVVQMPSARYEPKLALDGGQNGLDQIYRVSSQLKGKINPGGCVFMEIGLGQSRAIPDFLQTLFPDAKIDVLPDLAGIDRVIKIKAG